VNNSITDSIDILYHQPGHSKSVNVIQEIGEYIFTGSQEGRICIWDKKVEEELGCIYAHKSPIIDIQSTSDRRFLITSAQDLELKIWFMENFELADSQKAHIAALLGAKPINNHIISASQDLQLKKWSIKENKLELNEKTRVISMDKYFADENRLFISTSEGNKSVINAEDFKQTKSLFVSDSKALKAIRKASKYVKEFMKKDPHTILFNISRRNGFPILAFKATPDFIICGHEFGFVSMWDKKNLKLIKAFFTHGKHITGIDIHGESIYATSLDSTISKFNYQKQNIEKTINLPDKPLSLLKSSNNEFIIGLRNGEILVFDLDLQLLRKQQMIKVITSSDITPKNLLLSFNTGEIRIINYSNLETIFTKKIHSKAILGVFYYQGTIITIGDDNRILVLDENLDVLKEVEFTQKKTNVRRIKHYIVLTSNHVFDLRKSEVIKGEISGETEKELGNIEILDMSFEKGDILFRIQKRIFNDVISKDIRHYYSQEIIEAIYKLTNASNNSHYKKTSDYTILSKNIIIE